MSQTDALVVNSRDLDHGWLNRTSATGILFSRPTFIIT